jgi:hypothetical protein
MNKTVLKSFIGILILLLTACYRSGYRKADGKMYYYTSDFERGEHEYEVEGADLSTFEVDAEHGDYARDKNHIYIWGNVIEADTNSFRIIKSEGYFSTDRYHVFHGSKILQDADPLTFQIVDEKHGFVKDAGHVYLHSQLVDVADAATFVFLKEADDKRMYISYMKDIHHVYYWYDRDLPTVMDVADPGTFQLLEGAYTKDANHVYCNGEQMPGVDIETFAMAGTDYARDANRAYYFDEALEGIEDPATFRLLYTNGLHDWCRDRKAYYFERKKISGIDYNSFEILNEGKAGYAKDKNNVYYCGYSRRADVYPSGKILYVGKVKGADPETFELAGKYKSAGKDKYGYYDEERKTPKHQIRGLR